MPIIIVYITQYLGEAEGRRSLYRPIAMYICTYLYCMHVPYVKSQQSLPSYIYVYISRCMCTGVAATCILITTAFTIHYTGF